jgi:hypothetical protein
VLRQPLAADDVASLRLGLCSDTHADPAAYADLIGVLMNAPEPVFRRAWEKPPPRFPICTR